MSRQGVVRRGLAGGLALGQFGFPFAIGRAASPVDRFRALARRSRFGRHGPAVRLAMAIAMTLLWPAGAVATARRVGAKARARGRDYGWARLADMVWLAWRHSIPPVEYALYRFDDPARRKDMHDYVYWNDLPGLAALWRRNGADNRDVQDKHRFAEICAAHDIAHVPTLAVFEHGRQTFPQTPFEPEAPLLWVKSLRLKGGAGGAKWRREGGRYRGPEGRELAPAALIGEWRKTDCLVQPVVANHLLIATVSNGALASLRILTGINSKADAEFITAMLGLPHGHWSTSVASICCSVDRETGRVRHAAMPSGESVEFHPDTGTAIAGLVLPFWQESCELVLRAHRTAFAKFPFLGWDIAVTADGPVLLETNSGWGAMFHQMLDGPLGHTAFSRLLSHYV